MNSIDMSFSPEEMKIDPKLAGGRCIGQIRCSRREQAKKSIPQQREWLCEFARINNMEYVTEMEEAVSATQIKKRPDLARIYERKRTLNDFDTVIVQDLSRLTRGGVKHGLEIFFKFMALGIRLVSLVEGFIDGDDKIIEAARRFQEARAATKATTMIMRRGYLAARKKRKLGYTFVPPFAVDRLIVTEQGTPMFRLRNMRDRSQQKLSPDGKTLLHTYPPNIVGERRRHVKQADEFESYAPGDPRDVATVNRMYQWYYVDEWSLYSIAKALNDERVLTATGIDWGDTAVKQVLMNSTYLNKATGDRTSDCEFYKNGPAYPLAKTLTEGPLAKYRPEHEWHHESHKEMETFLNFDEATKASIYTRQLAEHRRRASKLSKARGGGANRHAESRYLLSGILREKTIRLPLTGRSGHSRRYGISKAINKPKSNNPLGRTFTAEPLDTAMRNWVGGVLKSYSGIVSVTRAVADEYFASAKPSFGNELTALRSERDAMLGQIDFWVKQLSQLGPEQVTGKVIPLRDSVVALGRRIAALEHEESERYQPVAAEPDRLEAILKQVAADWDHLPNSTIKDILKIVIQKMEIDFVTNEVDLELRLPSWAATRPNVFLGSLEKTTLECHFSEAPVLWSVPLGTYRFLYRPMTKGGMLLLTTDRLAA